MNPSKNSQTYPLQPGVLIIFRFGIGLDFLYLIASFFLQDLYLGKNSDYSGRMIFYIALFLLMALTLSLNRFVEKMKKFGFIVIVFAMTALSYMLPDIMKAQADSSEMFHVLISALWLTVPLLLIPLSVMAAQTNFRQTTLYVLLVTIVDFLQVLSLKNTMPGGTPEFYAELGTTLLVRLLALMLIGHIISLVVNSRKKVECELLEANQKLAEFNEQLETRIAERTRELYQANEKTLLGWVKVLEMRDFETEGHCVRVSTVSALLARELNVTDEQTSIIQTGALLHDIGKLSVSDSILLKPGKLNEQEWSVMKGHSEFGYQMLHEIEFLEPCLEIVHYHHERWDGNGYPLGLKGEEIPFNARLFSVIDVWDALTSDRPYRAAWSQEKATDYIRSQAGIQFDPNIVEAFLHMQLDLADETTDLSMDALPQQTFRLKLGTMPT